MLDRKWHPMPDKLPTDGATVWVRRVTFSSPWLAVWTLAAATFTATVTGLVCPWYAIARWRNP